MEHNFSISGHNIKATREMIAEFSDLQRIARRRYTMARAVNMDGMPGEIVTQESLLLCLNCLELMEVIEEQLRAYETKKMPRGVFLRPTSTPLLSSARMQFAVFDARLCHRIQDIEATLAKEIRPEVLRAIDMFLKRDDTIDISPNLLYLTLSICHLCRAAFSLVCVIFGHYGSRIDRLPTNTDS